MRLVMVFTMGVMPQDAYYYFYSEHLALSYFDHPPGVAIYLWLFTHLLGAHAWSLKLADFLIACFTLFVFYRLAQRFLSRQRSVWSVFLFGTTLIVTDISIVSTPDVPLMLFWGLALIALYDALHRPRIWQWFLAGLLAGLAFDSKYTAAYLPAGLFVFLILSKEYRRRLYFGRFAVYVCTFVTTALPVILWNVRHQFASFQFQSGERMASMMQLDLRPQYFFGTIGHQMLMVLPVLFISIMIVSWKYCVRILKRLRMPDGDTLFLLIFSVPLLLFFFAISWIYWVKINWMLPAYFTGCILAFRFLRRKHMRAQMITAIIVHVLVMVQIVFYPVPIQSDDTYWGWRKLTTAVTSLHQQYPGHFLFSNDGYKTTAILNFYLDTKVYAGNIIGHPALQYSIVDKDLSSLAGRNALFIDSQNMPSRFDKNYVPPPELSRYFTAIRVLPVITLYDHWGRALRQFAVVECLHYQPAGKR